MAFTRGYSGVFLNCLGVILEYSRRFPGELLRLMIDNLRQRTNSEHDGDSRKGLAVATSELKSGPCSNRRRKKISIATIVPWTV